MNKAIPCTKTDGKDTSRWSVKGEPCVSFLPSADGETWFALLTCYAPSHHATTSKRFFLAPLLFPNRDLLTFITEKFSLSSALFSSSHKHPSPDSPLSSNVTIQTRSLFHHTFIHSIQTHQTSLSLINMPMSARLMSIPLRIGELAFAAVSLLSLTYSEGCNI